MVSRNPRTSRAWKTRSALSRERSDACHSSHSITPVGTALYIAQEVPYLDHRSGVALDHDNRHRAEDRIDSPSWKSELSKIGPTEKRIGIPQPLLEWWVVSSSESPPTGRRLTYPLTRDFTTHQLTSDPLNLFTHQRFRPSG